MASRKAGRLTAAAIPPALAAALMLFAPAAGAGLYCCYDAAGRKVCADAMPTSCVGRDTTVSSEGRTKQLARPLTREERALRDDEAARKKEADEAAKEQRRQDQALLSTYVSIKDIDVARSRAEKDVQAQIKAAETKIATATARQKQLQTEAEFYKNKPVPEDIRRGLKDSEFEIKAQGELIETKKKDYEAIKTKFDSDKKRYEALSNSRAGPR